jgi:hypothetical protein
MTDVRKTLPILEYFYEWLCNVKDRVLFRLHISSVAISGIEKTGSGIRDAHPGSYFRELDDNVLGKNT